MSEIFQFQRIHAECRCIQDLLKYFLLATCADPTPENGQVKPNSNGVFHEENTVSFSCSYGYNLTGEDSSTCQADGTWRPHPPTCLEGNLMVKVFFFKINYYFINLYYSLFTWGCWKKMLIEQSWRWHWLPF